MIITSEPEKVMDVISMLEDRLRDGGDIMERLKQAMTTSTGN